MILVKLGSFMFYRDMIIDLIRFAERNFWNVTYDETGTQILDSYDKLGMTMIYTFTFIVYVATFNYIFAPFFGIFFRLCCIDKCYSNYHVKRRCTTRQRKYFFAVYNRISRNERNRKDFTFQAMDRFSISFTILRSHLHHTGNV